ncbi:unnamed protein product [Rotaria magnacalcarata]|uniref:Uncharacterized protein n=1 Tax=Rotaria magnacalcarata TaxID=392030 RepID=A0A814E1R6_9BILA|nr:unnamed protein product [Rotaria magnacalcarata]CAF5023321.1 unnamed protein product [Rotaria magnacalcarata]
MLIRYGISLLDASPLISQALDFDIVEDLSVPSSNYDQQYQFNSSAYYLNNAQTIFEPQYEYGTSSWGSQTANNNEKVEIYWTRPYEDTRVTLQHLGLPID